MLAVGAIKTPAAEVRCLNSPFEECVVVGISSAGESPACNTRVVMNTKLSY